LGGNVEFRADLARYKRQDKAEINEARETCSVNPEVSLRILLVNGNILLTWLTDVYTNHTCPTSYYLLNLDQGAVQLITPLVVRI